MTLNLSPVDRTIRLLVAAVIAGVLLQQVHGTALWLWLLLPLVLGTTALIGYCPLYAALGLNTHRSQLP